MLLKISAHLLAVGATEDVIICAAAFGTKNKWHVSPSFINFFSGLYFMAHFDTDPDLVTATLLTVAVTSEEAAHD